MCHFIDLHGLLALAVILFWGFTMFYMSLSDLH